MSFSNINWLPILLPAIIGIFHYKYFTKALKSLYLFVLYGTFNEIFSRIIKKVIEVQNTMPQEHIYCVVSLITLSVFYIHSFEKYQHNRRYYLAIGGIVTFYTVYAIFIAGIWSYPSLQYSVNDLIFVSLSILFLHKIMVEAKLENLFAEPLIWINTAILFYFTGSLFFDILFNLNLKTSVTFTKITIFYFSISNALFYILISIGFLKSKSTPAS